MAEQQPVTSSAGDREIPDKLYFRIGEVARLCEVPPYVLRFWESQFPQLKPKKAGTGQRLYRRRDVEMALRVRALLYGEGYTIPGARQLLKSELRHREPALLPGLEEAPDVRKLKRLRKELRDLLAVLEGPVGTKQTAAIHSIRPAGARKTAAGVPPEGLFSSPLAPPDYPF